jgi:Glutaredoxin-like domain (DUF836)
MEYVLLGTSGCHLCELAEEMIDACCLGTNPLEIEKIDIAEQNHWQQDYATQIPVLLHLTTLQSLRWPFTQWDVKTFLEQHL